MNLREVRDRIASVKSTQKITSAMKLVSSAKLRRAQATIEGMLPYSNRLNALLVSFLQGTTTVSSPFSAVRECRKVVVIAVSSNTGLCGTFNANIANKLRDVVRSHEANGAQIEIYTVGKKIFDAAKKLGYTPREELMAQAAAPQYDDVAKAVRARLPEAEITVMAVLPRRGREDRVEQLNVRLRAMAKENGLKFKDQGKAFLLKDGKVDESLFTDGLHPNGAGYQKIAKGFK